MEERDGFVGEVVISNQAGIQILNLPDQGTRVSRIDAPPPEPRVMPQQRIERLGNRAAILVGDETPRADRVIASLDLSRRNKTPRRANDFRAERFETRLGIIGRDRRDQE